MQSYKVVSIIFDMDGVITDTMLYHFKAWQQVFLKAGIKVNFNDIYKREGQKGIESVREIFKEHGVVFKESLANELLLKKEEFFKRIFRRKYILGSRPFIRNLSKQGFRLALVTGTSRHEAERLLPASIWNLFEVTVCGSDVANGKPHPEPYLKALQKLSIHPSQALVIENAPFGIRSAKAAGIKCVAIATSLPKTYLVQADCIVNSFAELKQTVTIK